MRLTIVGVIASPDGFQSTHSCRVRLPNRHAKGKQQSFQSTHSCRVRRRCHVSVLPECRYFNPRTRVECDRMPDHSSRYVAYFNPRTRVECDAVPDRKTLARIAFQSTHSCRVRLEYQWYRCSSKWHFNPRTRVECDAQIALDFLLMGDFNPRTRVECDIHLSVHKYSGRDFNPRTRVECDHRCYNVHIADVVISIHALV